RPGKNRADGRPDRRKRLSHLAAEGPAGAWGRRFRLPTDSFTDPQGAVLVAVLCEPHQKLRYRRNGRRSLSGKKAGGKGPATESTRRRLRPGFHGCSRRSLNQFNPPFDMILTKSQSLPSCSEYPWRRSWAIA